MTATITYTDTLTGPGTPLEMSGRFAYAECRHRGPAAQHASVGGAVK